LKGHVGAHGTVNVTFLNGILPLPDSDLTLALDLPLGCVMYTCSLHVELMRSGVGYEGKQQPRCRCVNFSMMTRPILLNGTVLPVMPNLICMICSH